jgi:hypothetical protein
MNVKDDLLVRANEYASRNRLLLRDELEFGVHGIVLLAKNQAETARSAIIIHRFDVNPNNISWRY